MMTRKKLITVVSLAVLALACSETVGGIMQDAGDMLADAGDAMRDAGDMMQPDAGADFAATCNLGIGVAEFPISRPGETMATVCYDASPGDTGPQRPNCFRTRAWWYEGTSTGFIYCGSTVRSITVHD